ncbi:MAG: hypothetical protein HFH26_05085, partial [Clostridiaceae bacterium]|nr:hypothetical protein [Clostridiaceae bacterium]
MKINPYYQNLETSYLFSTIAHKVNAYQKAHPDAPLIRLGIGDVTLPLVPVVVDALRQAAAEQGVKETFRGYGDEQGYDFLRQAIQGYYAGRGVALAMEEITVKKQKCPDFSIGATQKDSHGEPKISIFPPN